VKLTVLKNHVPLDVVLVDTPDPSERYEIFVGRADDCHVRIDDPLISRHHFVLKSVDGGWVCEKKSQLGTLTINGQSGAKLPVHNNDEIMCGIYSVIVSEISTLAAAPNATTTRALLQTEPEIVEDDLPAMESVEDLSELSTAGDLGTEALSLDDNLGDLSENDFEKTEASDELKEDSLSDLESDQNYGNNDLGGNLDNESPDNDIGSQDDFSGNEEITENGFNADDLPGDEYTGGDISSQDLTGTRFDRNFLNYQLKLFGEHAPYDRYLMTETETFIGRDPKKCQIILNDPEVSNVHAVVRKTASEVVLEDLNSSNGTILNGERINRAQITTGDEFVVGSTSFTLEVRSELLDAEADRLMPVEQGQMVETEEVVEEEVPLDETEGFETGDTGPADNSLVSKIKHKWNTANPKQKIIYSVVLLAILFVLLPDEEENLAPVKKPVATKVAPKNTKPPLSKDLETRRNVAYELGFDFFNQRRYNDALREFQIVADIDPTYKEVQTFLDQTKQSLKALEQLEAERRAAEERIKTKKIVEDLLAKARDAVKEHQVAMAESYFGQITEKDPENIEVQQLKLELETWQREDERRRIEEAAKAAARKAMVEALTPGKTFYIKKEWYKAILKLEDFLRKKGMDEDLMKEASEMLSDSKNQLSSELGPVLGKARSLKEGQDLKSAYESFLEVLKIEPTNVEALNEVDDIRTQLDSRSKRVYREAIISESLSLFNDAKEKFQEVQQISPTDSEYYRKATDKLKNYLE
jgi:pSer/pThr/pTyr-binding forkhead associated (FHA) protein